MPVSASLLSRDYLKQHFTDYLEDYVHEISFVILSKVIDSIIQLIPPDITRPNTASLLKSE